MTKGFWGLNIASYCLTLLGLLSLFQSQIDLVQQLQSVIDGYRVFWYALWNLLIGWMGVVIPDYVKDVMAIWGGLALSFRFVLEDLSKSVESTYWEEQYMTEAIAIRPVTKFRGWVFHALLRRNVGPWPRAIMRFFDYLLAPLWYILLLGYMTFSSRARREAAMAAVALANIVFIFLIIIGINHYLKGLGS